MPLGPEDVTLTGKTLTAGTLSGSTLVNCVTSGLTGVLTPQTSTVTPLKFTAPATAGELNAVATVGGVEFDGKAFYASVQTSARGVVRAEQLITQTTAYTGTTVLTAQKLFDASTGLTTGGVVVGPDMTYMFETAFYITNRSTTSNTMSFGFIGGAAITRLAWTCVGVNAAASSVPTAALITRSAATANVINAASTLPQFNAYVTGKVVIGTSGTLVPAITRSAGTVALVTAADSYFKIYPIGGDVNRVGHWG